MPSAAMSTSEAATAAICASWISAERMKRVRMPGPEGLGTAYFFSIPATNSRWASGICASMKARSLRSGMWEGITRSTPKGRRPTRARIQARSASISSGNCRVAP